MSHHSAVNLHKQHIRKIAPLLAFVVIALVGGCAKNSDKPQPDGGAKKFRVALLTPGPITDKSWNGGAYDGLVTLRDSLGAEISHIQTKTPADFEENFRQYGAQGYNLVLGHGFEFQDAAVRVAPAYPKTNYVVTSGRVVSSNLAGVSFLFQ